MNYICKRCGKIYLHKGHYTNHINRKRPCVNDLDKILRTNVSNSSVGIYNSPESVKNRQSFVNEISMIENRNELTCKYCNVKFKRKDYLIKHQNRCKIKQSLDEEIKNKDRLIEFLIEEKNLLSKQNQITTKEIAILREDIQNLTKLILSNKPTKIINNKNNNSNNNSNNITNNIVVKFGSEDMNVLTLEEKLKICTSSFSAIKNYIESMHFNDRLPEYHNVYISDKKFKYGLTFDGAKFELQHLDHIIDDLLSSSTDNIEDIIKQHDVFSQLSEKNINHIKKLVKMIKYSREQWFIHDRRYEIKMILYNNKKVVEETHKITEDRLDANAPFQPT